MTKREQELLEELDRLKQEGQELVGEIDRLWEANAALCLERDATDDLLGRALDLLSEYGKE